MRFPPYADIADTPNAVYDFRGKATIFGNTVCDGKGLCQYTEVIQYDSNTNSWIPLGNMVQSRKFHAVIEVPVDFCSFNDHPLYQEDSVAMIIGGGTLFSPNGEEPPITPLDTVELFGCPNSGGASVNIDPFPVPAVGLGGAYYSENETFPNGQVIVCGGFNCVATCTLMNTCYQYTPENGWTEEAISDFQYGRFAHLIALSPDLASGSNTVYPIAIGTTSIVEMYDPQQDEWRDYQDLEPSAAWLSVGCVVQYRYSIFRIGDVVQELDLLQWELNDLDPVPELLAFPGRCAMTKIDGEVGTYSGKVARTDLKLLSIVYVRLEKRVNF